MSQFNFDQQLSDAMRMDQSMNLNGSIVRQSLRPCNRLNVSGVNLNRSRSASRLSPSLLCQGSKPLNRRSKSPARRSKTPTRLGTSFSKGNVSSNNIYNGRKSQGGSDRFIPNRSTTDIEYAQHSLSSLVIDNDNTDNISTAEFEKRKMMEENLNPGDHSRILSFKSKAPVSKDGHLNNMKVLYSTGKAAAPKAANTRNIPSAPDKILDAPDMLNDFYLHLMDWSSLNHMAVALSAGVYIWNAADGSIMELCQSDSEDEYVSSVSWIKQGNVLAVGDSQGQVQLWDAATSKLMRSMDGHNDRVGCIDWNHHILASGGRDGVVVLHDVRVAQHQVSRLTGHQQEVCGLTWSSDGKTLASGGNDNCVQIWNMNRDTPLHTITAHQSAVKAVSWCPWQSQVLATAGGTVDRTIRLWNTNTMTELYSCDTGSQVSAIAWNAEYKELVTGHGFSHNQLTIWKYPRNMSESLMKVSDLTGHTSRVLLLTTSPDNTTVASVAADETIRLWKIWPQIREKKSTVSNKKHPVSMLAQSIR